MNWGDLMANRTLKTLDRKSTRLNSSHTVIYTLSLHDALPISPGRPPLRYLTSPSAEAQIPQNELGGPDGKPHLENPRSEEHTSELQSHSDLHSFPTRRSSDLTWPPTASLFDKPVRRGPNTAK